MSIEQALQANTDAINKLNETILNMSGTVVPPVNENVEEKPKKAPAKKKAAAKKEEPKVEPVETDITFEELEIALVELVAKEREEAVKILEHFGVARISELKEERYAEAYGMFIAAKSADKSEQSLV